MRALKQALKIVMEHNNITEGENKKQDVVEPEGEHSIKKGRVDLLLRGFRIHIYKVFLKTSSIWN